MGVDPRMRDASRSPARDGFTCEACARAVTTSIEGLYTNAKVGSPTRFCGPACRQAAYRRRQAGVAENTPLQYHGGRGRSLRDPDRRSPNA